MHDGLEFEKLGIPAAVICTEEFVLTAQAMAKLCGAPDYPFVIIPHPIGSLTAEELQMRADMAKTQVENLLLAT